MNEKKMLRIERTYSSGGNKNRCNQNSFCSLIKNIKVYMAKWPIESDLTKSTADPVEIVNQIKLSVALSITEDVAHITMLDRFASNRIKNIIGMV